MGQEKYWNYSKMATPEKYTREKNQQKRCMVIMEAVKLHSGEGGNKDMMNTTVAEN